MTFLGSLELGPGSQGKQVNSWSVSFETECRLVYTEHDSCAITSAPSYAIT